MGVLGKNLQINILPFVLLYNRRLIPSPNRFWLTTSRNTLMSCRLTGFQTILFRMFILLKELFPNLYYFNNYSEVNDNATQQKTKKKLNK